MKRKLRKYVSICMDIEVHEELREIADQEMRSVSGQVRHWIRQAIAEQERKKAKKANE